MLGSEMSGPLTTKDVADLVESLRNKGPCYEYFVRIEHLSGPMRVPYDLTRWNAEIDRRVETYRWLAWYEERAGRPVFPLRKRATVGRPRKVRPVEDRELPDLPDENQ